MSLLLTVPRNPLATLLLLLALLLPALPAAASDPAAAALPAALEPWRGWVLEGVEGHACPPRYDRDGDRVCAWPGPLELEVTAGGAAFHQPWHGYQEGPIPLPGDDRLWPTAVTVDGKPAAVVARDGRPSLRLGPGDHTVAGRLEWRREPDLLQLPAELALSVLRRDGRPVALPEVDTAGRLRLHGGGAGREGGEEERLSLRVFRLVEDEIPLRLTTRLELNVSGRPREVTVGPALGAGFVPLALESPLPARLEPDGRLRVQLRPGRWRLTLTARHAGPLDELRPAAAAAPWPAEEVWSFAARHELRLVEPTGPQRLDPQQTEMPAEWRGYPAFLLRGDAPLTLVEKRRGDPEPAPDRLDLQRELRLDFDGRGYSLRDHIGGTVARSWRLEAEPPLALGRVAVEGRERFITRLGPEGRAGIEVRPGPLDLTADGRIEGRPATLPAGGWGNDFQSVDTTLLLPPGWRLFSVQGADAAGPTWLQRWTLLDLFLVLMTALATRHLYGWRWGAVALAGLALSWHEPGAPGFGWLPLLALAALLRALPPGRARDGVRLLYRLGLVGLAVALLPFAVEQVRQGLFPVLERPWLELGGEAANGVPAGTAAGTAALPAAAPQALMSKSSEAALERKLSRPRPAAEGEEAPPRTVDPGYDPASQIQTGPGVPAWEWHRAELRWSGPVAAGEGYSLLLIPPPVNTLLAFLRVGLLLALALGIAGLRHHRGADGGRRWRLAAGALLLPALLPLLLRPTPAAAADFPPEPLLEELQQRLTQAPECLPRCAELARLDLEARPDRLTLRLELHAAARVAVPLPGGGGGWLPTEVSDAEGKTPPLRRDGGGTVWVVLEPGVQRLVASGPPGRRDGVMVALPLPPRALTVSADGWQVAGLDEEGRAGPQLELRRDSAAAESAEAPPLLPAFLQVERHLDLGLSWGVETRVRRLNPGSAGVVAAVPLLAGESVVSGGVTVHDGAVQVSLAPGQNELSWRSLLAPAAELTLAAPPADAWTESWQVTVSPHWHATFDGLPPLRQADGGGPLWRPWPGERLTLHAEKPQGVAGATLTLDRAEYRIAPGGGHTRYTLRLLLRTSQGGQHRIELPADAEPERLAIDGREQALPAAPVITLPLVPGRQEVELAWRRPGEMATLQRIAPLPLGLAGVDGVVALEVPEGRWLLYAGGGSGAVGPAILFWGIVAVAALAAVALGRSRLTPLGSGQWFLLGIGLAPLAPTAAVVVVGWLLALAGRDRLPPATARYRFNAVQVGLVLLTLAALATLFAAIQAGLLGYPDMQVLGNGSHNGLLRWYRDRIDGSLPGVWALSVPLWIYRLPMLGWALWLAWALLGWLRWGWRCFGAGGIWRGREWHLPGGGGGDRGRDLAREVAALGEAGRLEIEPAEPRRG